MGSDNIEVIPDENEGIAESEGWIRVECTNAACRGKRRGGVAHLVWIKKSLQADYEAGKYWPECNECFSR